MDDKKQLYQLIISQLAEDGYTTAAAFVSDATMTMNPSEHHKERLAHLVTLGSAIEKEKGIQLPRDRRGQVDVNELLKEIRGVDLDAEVTSAAPTPNYQRRFITQHKKDCTIGKFTADGKFIATGSADTSIKLLEVEKMLVFKSKDSVKVEYDDTQMARPVVKNFYDHTGAITDIDFHPTLPLLASCATDCSVKLYETNSSGKKASKHFLDTHSIRSINFHPSGDYLLASGDHTAVRLWDLGSEKVYVNPRTEQNHFGPVNVVRYSSDGRLSATCSTDGSIKLWDGVSNDCVNTIVNAHGGEEVCSIQFSRNRKYLLSIGKDSMIRIWDVTAGGRQLRRIFTGPAKRTENKLSACFSYNEEHIFSTDETTTAVSVWDTRTGESVQKLAGHTGFVRSLASSPVAPHLISCSDDHWARFWVEENDHDTLMTDTS